MLIHRQMSLLAITFVLGLLSATAAHGTVFYSKKGAFDAAFPGAEVEQVNVFLTDDDARFIRAQSGVEWKGRLANVYVARRAGAIVGYGYIDTHQVRTLNETVMLVLTPDGHVEKVLQLAFHEPAEYQAPSRWLAQFCGRALSPKLSLKGDIDGLSGATLTSRKITARIRALLALHQRRATRQG